jgi:hypothetical protein
MVIVWKGNRKRGKDKQKRSEKQKKSSMVTSPIESGFSLPSLSQQKVILGFGLRNSGNHFYNRNKNCFSDH